MSVADPAVLHGAHCKGAYRIEQVGPGSNHGHRCEGKAAGFHQVKRQPRENEIIGVVGGKVSDSRSPERALPQNQSHGNWNCSALFGAL